MKKDPLYKLLKHSNATGLLCNQSSWNSKRGQYTFQSLATTGKLKKVFIPEHGLFGELQDQVKLDDTTSYRKLDENIEWISLYNSGHGSLTPSGDQLKEIDTLIIDIQDTGSRYYTFTSTIWLILEKITTLALPVTIVVIDKPNPAGRQVEGTRMTKEYASFIGLEGLPHRHGLTIGELCRYFKNRLSAKWELLIIPSDKKEFLFIPPSPNIPAVHTCTLYSGQSLWEGTNISEGRGTTLPFEMIGAPFIDWMFGENWNDPGHPAYDRSCFLRPVRFIPVFHKHQGQVCEGLHLIPKRKQAYHSLSHSLKLIKHFRTRTPQFTWREGTYEAFNDRKAIELLVGDRLLLDFLEDKADWKEVKIKLMEEERQWMKEASPFRIYKSSLKTLKFK